MTSVQNKRVHWSIVLEKNGVCDIVMETRFEIKSPNYAIQTDIAIALKSKVIGILFLYLHLAKFAEN